MNKPVWIYILLLALLVPANVEAQRWKLRRYEAGIGLGTVTAFMDIGSPEYGITSFRPYDTRVSLNTHLGYKLTEDFTLKVDMSYLMIGAIDPVGRTRSLRFTSHGFEHGIRLDYTFFGGGRAFSSTLYNRRGMVNNYDVSYLYVFAGGSGILSRATVMNNEGGEVDPDVNLNYNNNLQWGVVIPVGFGYKQSIDAYFDLAVEVGGRFSFTDLIDGYQHATASYYNDKYIITSVKAIYKIRNDRQGLPILRKYGRR